MRNELKYKCSECGKTYTYDREEVKGNSLISKIWGDHRHAWPVWAICSDCMEERNESNLMWPVAKGPKREMSCHLCEFEIEYPEVLLEEEDEFKCPQCGHGEVS